MVKRISKKPYDVIIVGAGPAGAILGYELAKMGVEVAILEKERLPRYKPCGGGVQFKVANLLDFDIKPVVESTIYELAITCKFRDKFTKGYYNEPLVYTVMRDKFDDFLVRKAKEVGVVVYEGQRVDKVEMKSSEVRIFTPDCTFTARIAVGADGAKSVVARELDLMKGVPFSVGIESEIQIPAADMAAWNREVACLDIGTLPGGYGWVFPKADHLSIGVGASMKAAKRLRSYYDEFREFILQHQHVEQFEVLRCVGHLLPFRKAGMPIQRGRVLLVGDAAGLTDALTGEGIYYAIRSAKLAAPVIKEVLEADPVDLQDYERAVDEQLMPELTMSKSLMRVLDFAPVFFHRLLKRGKEGENANRPWGAFCRLLRGETNYVTLKNNALKKGHQFLLGPLKAKLSR